MRRAFHLQAADALALARNETRNPMHGETNGEGAQVTWLGLDGEGIGRFPHRYVMLCLNSADGEREDYVEDVNGLTTNDCLSFLLDSAAARDTKGKHGASHNVCGYYLTYDWTKILADLPHKTLYKLLRPELRACSQDEGGHFLPVRWRGYKLHYLSGMMRISKGNRTVTVWDVGKYYQARFVAALEQSGIAPTDLIRRMKAARGTDAWDDRDLDTMRAYCLEECKYLAQLVELLEAQHEAIDLYPKVWHGPGSTAGTLLKKHAVETFLKKPPPAVEHAANCAYFGGRFEHSIMGKRDDCTSYDVRSAYPYAATTLPCLAHGKWVHVKREPKEGELAVIKYRVKDIGNRVWGPLPCRLENGTIVWSRGDHTGWAWSVEYWPAKRGWNGVHFAGEAFVLRKKCNCVPFSFVPELYEWRVSRPENKQVVKLALNSLYGKLAQTIGGGKYACRVWAGIITATCRARMLELITMHEDERNLFAIATDGAYSAEYFDIDEPGLGNWEVERKGRMTFLRPGIYWSEADVQAWYAEPGNEKIRERALKGVKARGVGRSHMLDQVEDAEQAVEEGRTRIHLGTSVQFGSARECVYKTPKGVIKRSQAYGEWCNMPVSLSLRPEPKRAEDWTPPRLNGVESWPYNKAPQSRDAKALQLIGSLLQGRIR